MSQDDDFLNLQGPVEIDVHDAAASWKILIVDDEPDVHRATVFAIKRVLILGKRIEFRHAYNSNEAIEWLRQEPDIAVVLLDVVMEREDSGLVLVRRIRDELHLQSVRIILRTGQPGYAPEIDVIRDYDINDYRTKSELTQTRLYTALTTAIRSYQQLQALTASRQDLERVNNERLELEATLQQAQKIESVGQLAGGIAHDFNNILGAIFGYLHLAKMLPVADESIMALYLDEIGQAANRARELVQQLLVFSRRGTLDGADQIRVDSVVHEVFKLIKATFPATISIDLEMQGDLPEVRIRPVNLHQVLMNLAINGRDAMEQGGHLSLRVGRVDKPQLTPCSACHQGFSGDFVMMAVRDTGGGISTDNLDRIFNPFFTTKPVGQGTGLGLSVLHGIVHAAGGHMEVVSQVGTGTEFIVYLPVAHADPAFSDTHAPGSPVTNCDSARVLVVDDEAPIVRVLTKLLAVTGCQADGFTDPVEALAAFRAMPDGYDIVITDQTMPQMTGVQLSAALLAIRPMLPIVLCTGFSNLVSEQSAREMGIRRFLEKPVPAATLISVIQELLKVAPRSAN